MHAPALSCSGKQSYFLQRNNGDGLLFPTSDSDVRACRVVWKWSSAAFSKGLPMSDGVSRLGSAASGVCYTVTGLLRSPLRAKFVWRACVTYDFAEAFGRKEIK